MKMDAIIGRYKARMDEDGLILTHPSGISFDLTAEETLGLLDFINVYRTALNVRGRETDPELESIAMTDPDLKRVLIKEQERQNS